MAGKQRPTGVSGAFRHWISRVPGKHAEAARLPAAAPAERDEEDAEP